MCSQAIHIHYSLPLLQVFKGCLKQSVKPDFILIHMFAGPLPFLLEVLWHNQTVPQLKMRAGIKINSRYETGASSKWLFCWNSRIRLTLWINIFYTFISGISSIKVKHYRKAGAIPRPGTFFINSAHFCSHQCCIGWHLQRITDLIRY